MNSGSDLVDTWIPDAGFEIQRRKVKAADGGSVVTDCLAPKWSNDELTDDRPLRRQPCLHRVLATCRRDQIATRKPDPGRPMMYHADRSVPVMAGSVPTSQLSRGHWVSQR
jgi:hypothetical protein